MKNLNAMLIMTLALASPAAFAQEALQAPFGAGDLPPAAGSGEFGDLAVPSGEGTSDYDGAELIPQPEADDLLGHGGAAIGAPMHALHDPLYFESSGTWLRRGYWYVEADFLMMNRGWERKGLILANEERVSQSNPLGQPFIVQNVLQIEGSKPGGEGLARVKLGRFLFRDARNRDHTAEFSFYGGGNWEQSSSVTASSANGLQVSNFIDRVNPSFDGARRMDFTYGTEVNSIEANYVVRSRMARDQLLLRPDGEWVRAANSTWTYSFLAGGRYLKMRDDLFWDAFDVPVAGAADPTQDGNYTVRTDNDLAGGQLGASAAYETARWSLGVAAKGGSFLNRMDLRSQFFVPAAANPNRGTTESTEDNIAFIGEFNVTGKWHLRPNLSLRAGFEVLFVDSLALAPFQVNFVRGGYEPIADDGDIVCMGSSLGIEYYR